MPQYEEGVGAQGAIFDFESQSSYEEDPSEEVLRRADERAAAEEAPSEETACAEPPSEEAPLDATVEQPRPNFDPPSEEAPQGPAQSAAEDEDERDYDPATGPRGRARRHAALPRRRAGGRRPLVRAEAAEGLRPRLTRALFHPGMPA